MVIIGRHRPVELRSFSLQLLQRCVDVERIPKNDDVDHEPECSELVLLAFPITLPQFSATTMKNSAGQLVSVFVTIELDQRSAALLFIA